MERAVQHIVALIDHLRLESLQEEIRCFYCGGLHRSVDCESPEREAFYKVLMDIAAEADDMNGDFCIEKESHQLSPSSFSLIS